MNPDCEEFLEQKLRRFEVRSFRRLYCPASALTSSEWILGMITIPNWMFLKSYEAFENKLLQDYNYQSLMRIEYHGFL